jgi:hypothetical protein
MSCNSLARIDRPMTHSVNRNLTERGSALVEFVLCVSLFWIPLFFGATQYGFALIRAIQVMELCRDSGHMYAYGIDFSQSSNQYLLTSFEPSLNVDPTAAGGATVVILSTVQYVTTAMCQAGGYASTCPNYGSIVFTNQIVVGNPALHAGAFGKPATNSVGTVSMGSSSTAGYLNQSSAVVTGFPGITLTSGASGAQYAYISEVFSKSSGLNWFLPATPWVNARAFF